MKAMKVSKERKWRVAMSADTVRFRTLIHDWNEPGSGFDWANADIQLDDETLRDGLQNPSVVDPSIDDKIALLHMMDQLEIDTADIGLPGAGPRAVEAVTELAKEIDSAGLSITANCAARTLLADVRPVAEISQATGVPIEVCAFIGSSPIRQGKSSAAPSSSRDAICFSCPTKKCGRCAETISR